MRIGRILVTAACAAVIGLATATSSYADGPVSLEGTGFELTFMADGDYVQICDRAADGYGADAWVYDNGTALYTIYATGGDGSCTTRDASWHGVYDLTEGHQYRLKGCRIDNNYTETDCEWLIVTA